VIVPASSQAKRFRLIPVDIFKLSKLLPKRDYLSFMRNSLDRFKRRPNDLKADGFLWLTVRS